MKFGVLPTLSIPKKTPLKITVERGFSSFASDIDNPTKPFLDCLQDKYGIDDKRIFKLDQEKAIVSKGNDYIKFNIEHYAEAKTKIKQKKYLQSKNKKL